MEKYDIKRKLTAAGVASLGVLGLSACANPDYEGTGNEFTVRGPIDEATNDLVEISEEELQILEAEGRADTWFERGFGQESFTGDFRFFNHFHHDDVGGFWSGCGGDVVVGEVFDIEGHEISLDELERGDMIELDGRIQDSHERSGKYCAYTGRAVFSEITVIQDN